MARTPLYSWHKNHAKNMVEFSGFDMPLAYEGIEEEHAHVRSKVGIFDVSHMGQIRVDGRKAKERLDFLFTNTLPKPNRVKYGMMLTEEGTVMDDMLIYGLSETGFILVPNAGNIDKIYAHCKEFIGHQYVKNQSSDYGMIAIQGPMANDIIQTYYEIPSIKRFQFVWADYDDDVMIISRTGYTGEDGYELLLPSYRLVDLWNDLLETTGIKPIGLGARDTLRFEACLPLYGHEISETITPVEAGLTFALDDKKDFRGKTALAEHPGDRVLMGIELIDKGIAREKTFIVEPEPDEILDEIKLWDDYPPNWHLEDSNNFIIGQVTTGYQLKSQGRSLALALIHPKFLNARSRIMVRGREKKFKTVDMPFINR